MANAAEEARQLREAIARREAQERGLKVAGGRTSSYGQNVQNVVAQPVSAPMRPSMEQIAAGTPVSQKDPVAVASAAAAQEQRAQGPASVQDEIAQLKAQIEREERRQRVEAQTKPPTDEEEWNRRVAEFNAESNLERGLRATYRTPVALAEMGLMMATGAAAEVVGGWVGLLGGGSVEERAARVEGFTDAMTFTPKTLTGDVMLRGLAKPLLWLDTQARDISEKASDSPLVQAGIYTAITGGVEVLSFKGAGKLKVDPKFDRALKEVQKTADDMGIKLTQTEMIDSIIDRAADISPAVRAQHAPELRDALLQARNQSRLVVQQQVGALRQTEASMRAGDVTQFANDLGTWMTAEGFDVAKMPGVKAALDDLGKIDKVSPLTGKRQSVEDAAKRAENAIGQAEVAGSGMIELPGTMRREMAEGAADAAEMARREVDEVAANHAVTLNEIQTIRNRMEKARTRIKQTGAEKFSDEAVALRTVETKLDEFLDNQFMNDMISGDDGALSGWRLATEARINHNRRFNEDRVIKQIMDRQDSPEAIRAFIFGQAAVSPKAHSVKVVRKLKEVLGKDHPAIKGMQQDLIFELTAPLMADRPNFSQFIRNYDHLVSRNPTLVKELGMNQTELRALRDFAHTASRLPQTSGFITVDLIAKAISRLSVGHAIAKQGMKVGIFATMLAKMFGKDSVSTRKIRADLVGATYGEPMISKMNSRAATAAQAAIMADLTDAAEENK